MWRACLALVGHRLLLLVTAFLVINAHLPSEKPGGWPQLHSPRELGERFLGRVAEGPEFNELQKLMAYSPKEVIHQHRDPFLWIARWVAAVTGFSGTTVLLLLSNIFLVLFLNELLALLSRMVTTDVAEGAAFLLILWPTSYELSLGSSFALTCFLATLMVRQAMDNKWLIGGLAAGTLAFQNPLVLGLLPLLVYLFWYFQRHYQWQQVVKRVCFFVIPLGVALFYRWRQYPALGEIFSQSALMNVFNVVGNAGRGAAWTVSQSYAGQTVTIIFFGVGAVFSALSNSGLLHRLIPLNMFLVLLLFSPYTAIASRAALAATCLEGVASASSPVVTRVVQILLLVLSLYEVGLVFSYA